MSDEFVIEKGKRLSQSMLWSLQRNFYDKSGVGAWNSGTVPHYITNNPRMAGAWADVVLGYLRDLAQQGQLDTESPFYLVEIGAGAGRHGFLLLRALEQLERASPLCDLDYRFVMVDFTQSNLDFWRSHASFQPFIERGRLDFARFDAENDQQLELQVSQETVSAQTLRNPMVFVANYLLDTLTQDAFRVENGKLLESLPTILADEEDMSLDAPDAIQRLEVDYSYRPASEDYYEDEVWNDILRSYRDSLGDTSFSFPIGPLRCFANLIELSAGRLMFMTADKAWNRLDDMIGLDDPEPIHHGGSFSLTVNFHAIAGYFERLGGVALQSTLRDAIIEASAFVLDSKLASLPETALAFERAVDQFGPIDFFNLKEKLQEEHKTPSLRMCLDLLRLSGWDPQVLYDFSEPMINQVENIASEIQREVRLALARVWDNFYPIGDDNDVPFELGRILYRMEYYPEAVEFYTVSLEMFGRHKMTLHNIGLCYYYLRDLGRAHDFFCQALEEDPDYGSAREWKLRVEGERNEASEEFLHAFSSSEKLRPVRS